jgi:hypothetical protein
VLLLCCRELAELEARGHDESWVPQSEAYQLVPRQLADLNAQLEARAKQLAAMQHERDELLRHFENKQAAAEVSGRVGGDAADRKRGGHTSLACSQSCNTPHVALPAVPGCHCCCCCSRN